MWEAKDNVAAAERRPTQGPQRKPRPLDRIRQALSALLFLHQDAIARKVAGLDKCMACAAPSMGADGAYAGCVNREPEAVQNDGHL